MNMASNKKTHTFYDRVAYMHSLGIKQGDLYAEATKATHEGRKWKVRGAMGKGPGIRVFYANPFHRGRIGVRECANYAIAQGYRPKTITSPKGKTYQIRKSYTGSDNDPVTYTDETRRKQLARAQAARNKTAPQPAPAAAATPKPETARMGDSYQAVADDLLALSARLESLSEASKAPVITAEATQAAEAVLKAATMAVSPEGVALVETLRAALAGGVTVPQMMGLAYALDREGNR